MGEGGTSHERIIGPKIGDIIRLKPGRRPNPEEEKWVVWSINGMSFGAGRLFELPDGTFELTGPGTFDPQDFAETLGSLDIEQMLDAYYKRMGIKTDEAKQQIRESLMRNLNQFSD